MPETRLQKQLRLNGVAPSKAVILHDTISEIIKYPSAKKRKPTIRHDNRKTSRRTKVENCKTRKSNIISSMLNDGAPGVRSTLQLLHLPAEILLSITSYITPSELCSIRGISKAFRAFIERLPIWQQICTSLGLGKPARKHKTYYALATTQMWRICDSCLTKTKGWGSDSPLTIKDTDDNKIGRLCCKCRCDHYKQNPEPAALVWNGEKEIESFSQITKSTATSHYKLLSCHLDSLPVNLVENPYYANAAPMQLYLELEVADAARKYHGGDIGIKKAREATRARGMQMRETKKRKIQERREALNKLLTDTGMEHHRNLQTCATYVSGHMTIEELTKVLQEIERHNQAQNARKRLAQNELESHGMPELINRWEIDIYIRGGHGCIEGIVRKLVNQELEVQRVAAVKDALKVRLNQIDNAIAHRLYRYDNIIRNPSNDIDYILETIVNREEEEKAIQAEYDRECKQKRTRQRLLEKKLSEHNIRCNYASPLYARYIATGSVDVDDLVRTLIEEKQQITQNKRASI